MKTGIVELFKSLLNQKVSFVTEDGTRFENARLNHVMRSVEDGRWVAIIDNGMTGVVRIDEVLQLTDEQGRCFVRKNVRY